MNRDSYSFRVELRYCDKKIMSGNNVRNIRLKEFEGRAARSKDYSENQM